TRVDSSGDHDSDDEVASIDNDMTNFLASKDVGYGTNSLLEQWKESYGNGEYDYDPYNNDMYDNPRTNIKEERCNTTLRLGIGVEVKREKQLKQKTLGFTLDLALPVHPKVEVTNHGDCDHKHEEEKYDQDSCSSKTIDDLEDKEKRGTKRSDSSNLDVYHDNSGGSRKKLKLTTEQITMLEDRFKIHSTLNMVCSSSVV
ncbi:hypothetical protein Tco_1512830, partial [Tanacetum coccineum]